MQDVKKVSVQRLACAAHGRRAPRSHLSSLVPLLLLLLVVVLFSLGLTASAADQLSRFVIVYPTDFASTPSTVFFDGATKLCNDIGLTLPVITNATENAELSNLLKNAGLPGSTSSYTTAYINAIVEPTCGKNTVCYAKRVNTDGTSVTFAQLDWESKTWTSAGQGYNSGLTTFLGTLSFTSFHIYASFEGTWYASGPEEGTKCVVCDRSSRAAVTSRQPTAEVPNQNAEQIRANVWIIGVAVGVAGGLILVAAVAMLAFFFCRKSRSQLDGANHITVSERVNENGDVEKVIKVAAHSDN